MNKKVLYTAIIGNYDSVRDPQVVKKGWDYILFTDNRNIKSKVWQVRYINNIRVYTDNKLARNIKILYHKYLSSQYEIIVWCDGNIQLRSDPDDFVNTVLDKGSDVAFMDHPDRNCVFAEAKACIRRNKDRVNIINDQLDYYISLGIPHNLGMIATGIMVRRNNDKIKKIMNRWWKEVNRFSHRDQLSINFVLWKFGNIITISYFSWNYAFIKFHKKTHR